MKKISIGKQLQLVERVCSQYDKEWRYYRKMSKKDNISDHMRIEYYTKFQETFKAAGRIKEALAGIEVAHILNSDPHFK